VTSATPSEQAPATFRAAFETSQGGVTIEVDRASAPLGADRFYTLVRNGFYDSARFFRVLPGFVVQFGIAGDPAASARWRSARIPDDPVKLSNVRASVSFATAGPGTRTTQVFINLADNSNLDSMGFSPFGRVVEGMEIVEKLYSGYGEGSPHGRGPDQGRIQSEGNAYLEKQFGKLDFIRKAAIATDGE
jgi:peptidyl-prolyl cis-trans isomerase A (cyclophilin A)